MSFSANDRRTLKYNAYTLASTCHDVLQLLDDNDDEVFAHLFALSKELTSETRRVWLDSEIPHRVG